MGEGSRGLTISADFKGKCHSLGVARGTVGGSRMLVLFSQGWEQGSQVRSWAPSFNDTVIVDTSGHAKYAP